MSAPETRRGQALAVRPAEADAFPSGKRRHVITAARNQWAMQILHEAGSVGVSRLDHASTSLPCYVYGLRQDLGEATIRTEFEEHGGEFPGTHARYYLTVPVAMEWVSKPKPKRAKAKGPDAVPPDPMPDARKPAGGDGGPSESDKLAGNAEQVKPIPSRPESQAKPAATGGHDAAA